MSKNAFPHFDDGDVQIRLSRDDKDVYILQSFILGLHSSFFKASLSERWTGNTEVISASSKIKWRYELRFEEKGADGILVRQVGTPHSCTHSHILKTCYMLTVRDAQPGQSSDNMTTTLLYSKLEGPVHQLSRTGLLLNEQRSNAVAAHKQLLGALYHLPPALSTESFAKARPSINALLEISKMYECASIVTTQVEKHLLQFSTEILAACTWDFFPMLKLSTEMRCDWMFKEAMIRLIGHHEMKTTRYRAKFDSLGIRELIDRKHAAFVNTLRDAEYRLFLEVDTDVCKSKADHKYAVLAVAYFRKWLKQQINAGNGSGLDVEYAKLYHLIRYHASDQEDMLQFLTEILSRPGRPLTQDIVHIFESHVQRLFQAARNIVAPLLVSNAKDVWGYRSLFAPLTFTVITDHDLPWKDKSL
ncbi:MAG: hypothetical protein M1836_001394 [Candelina mexicana]|nr:MAG: hypothetical protein M1836_001394 [Candelina mexicana]